MESLQEEEWKDWLQHPMTRLFHKWLESRREALKAMWANGNFTAQDQFGTAIANAAAIGECKAYQGILEADFQQVDGELGNE